MCLETRAAPRRRNASAAMRRSSRGASLARLPWRMRFYCASRRSSTISFSGSKRSFATPHPSAPRMIVAIADIAPADPIAFGTAGASAPHAALIVASRRLGKSVGSAELPAIMAGAAGIFRVSIGASIERCVSARPRVERVNVGERPGEPWSVSHRRKCQRQRLPKT